MGFRVSVSEESDRLFQRLKSNPASAFPEPYSGYLLFLAGAADQVVLDWLEKNILALDALTGNDVAFAVVAKEYRVRLQTHMARSSRSAPKRELPVSIKTIENFGHSVDRLVKSGNCGMISSGDELIAITYGSDAVARSLGVLSQLPCVVILDCLPKPEVCAITLTDEVREKFIPLLRNALHSYTQVKGYDSLGMGIRAILDIQRRLDEIDFHAHELTMQLSQERRKMSEVLELREKDDPHINLQALTKRVDIARESLAIGMTRRFNEALLRPPFPATLSRNLSELVDGFPSIFVTLAKSIGTLTFYAESQTWPLNDQWWSRYQQVVNKYVAPLLGIAQAAAQNTHDSCARLLSDLKEKQRDLIDHVMRHVPA